VQRDTSRSEVGGALVQETDQGDENPIAFVFKKFNKAQRHHLVTKQECLVAIASVTADPLIKASNSTAYNPMFFISLMKLQNQDKIESF